VPNLRVLRPDDGRHCRAVHADLRRATICGSARPTNPDYSIIKKLPPRRLIAPRSGATGPPVLPSGLPSALRLRLEESLRVEDRRTCARCEQPRVRRVRGTRGTRNPNIVHIAYRRR
jgi:hypothetical protein